MQNLILHMGPHKTGSTYLQKCFHEKSQVLSQSDIIYPKNYYLFYGHHYLLNALNGQDDVEDVKSTLLNNTDSFKNVLLSSENFISLSKHGLEKLLKISEGMKVTLVYYIRRPSLRLLSRWQEEIKHGGLDSVDSYFTAHLFKPMQSPEVNNFKRINLALNIFGRESVRIIDYDAANDSNEMLRTFFKALDLEPVIKDEVQVINKMVDLSEIEIIRYINHRAKSENILSGSNVRESYFRNRDESIQLIENIVLKVKTYNKAIELGDTGFDKNIYNVMNEQYSDLLVNEASNPKRVSKEVPSTNWLLNPGIVSDVEKLSNVILSSLRGKK
ncbi:hypothetical protein [Cobetia marina]|uniref:hypothetical protein n=1 Tax=Cobetia marina TaxID=28258 RepID=UPI00384FB6A4